MITTNTDTAPAKPAKRQVAGLEFLPVPFTTDEVVDLADQIARANEEKQRREEEFEVIKLDFKTELERLNASIRSITRKLTTRKHWENVDCVWQLETPSPREKTLIRLDTGEIVRCIPMDSGDYQDRLPLVLKTEAPAVVDNGSFSLAPPPANGSGKDAAAGDPPLQ